MSAMPQRYWEDVAEGEELDGFSLELTMTRMVLQVSGTQDFYPIHHDQAFARSAGHPDIFINTSFIRGCLCRVLTDWIGADGFVKRLGFQMRTPNLLGETISARGRVKQKGPDGHIEIEVWIESAEKGVTVPGSATVILPARR
ncbi:MAG: acyl dehydratase [Candidatus Rokubacteria bacterium]|nr:acyl dehydratase [Candidatus Rokubacteria bacterium]